MNKLKYNIILSIALASIKGSCFSGVRDIFKGKDVKPPLSNPNDSVAARNRARNYFISETEFTPDNAKNNVEGNGVESVTWTRVCK